jgi:DNA-binding XRE family transcriptional regulator
MLERIKKVVSGSGLSNGEFADKIGVQRSSISHILSGRNKPSLDFVVKLLRAFPSVDSNWLLFGKGDDGGVTAEGEPAKVVTSVRDEDPAPYVRAIKTPGGKSPERIVIFFSDGSFKSYLP